MLDEAQQDPVPKGTLHMHYGLVDLLQ